MNQEELLAFLMIVNCKSFSLAAEKLYISQPTLSNRLRSLEEKLGYPLINRKKGGHYLTLTDAGKNFIPIARKTQQLWMDAQAIPEQLNRNVLRVMAVNSIATYILPNVTRAYLQQNAVCALRVLTCHSEEGYQAVETGAADLAIISPELYGGLVETAPAYRTKMVCVSGKRSGLPEVVDTGSLIPENEIQVPWFPDYDNWRRNTVSLPPCSNILVGTMSVMESLIDAERWCLMPAAIAGRLSRRDVIISQIADPPPDQQVFYLKRRGDMTESMSIFLRCLHEELTTLSGTESYLRNL